MTRDEFKKFLTHGAICSEQAQNLRLFIGPFQRTSKRQAGEISLFCTDFFLTETRPWWVPAKSVVISRQEFKELCQQQERHIQGKLERLNWAAPEKTQFAPVFQSIQRDIKAGELGKAVPVVFEKATSGEGPSHGEKRAWLGSLADLPSSLSPYGVWDEKYLMMGATPELLFQRTEKGRTETMALAGTLPKEEQSQRVALLEDPKEMEEHEFVVSDIKARLESLGEVQVDAPEVLELPTLFHICSRMRVEDQSARPLSFEDLVRVLHPTPALGLYPRESGWVRLQNYSLGPRRAFGAPFGVYINDEDFRCWVAIRNIQWYEGYLWLGSGCGVVRQSELDREWQELGAKRSSVKHMLGMGEML